MDLAPEVAQIRDRLSEADQAIFDQLVMVAYDVNPAFQNSYRWRVATFTLNDNWHHWIFNINSTKTGMTLTFHKGGLLADPTGILSGEGRYGRLIRFKHADDIDCAVIADLVREAIAHQTDM